MVGSYTLAARGARRPGGAAEAFEDPWGQELLEVALSFQEAGGQRVRAHSVITRPVVPVSVGNHVTNGFFLIGLNGRTFTEKLSVKFGCFCFWFFLSSYSKQTAELFPQICSFY